MNQGRKPPKGESEARSIRRSVPIALIRAREAVMAHFRPLLVQRGYTEQQWRVLRVLDEFGPLDPTQLADKAALLMPSLTRILKTLEQKGAVIRRRDPDDGRRALILITPRALTTIATSLPGSNAAYDDIESQFGAEKMQELLVLLDRLANIKPPEQDM